MTPDEKRAYNRGYYMGSAGKWPEHRPLEPSNPLVAELMRCALALRDAVDGELATIEEDNPWQRTLGDPVDALDDAMSAISDWIRRGGQVIRPLAE